MGTERVTIGVEQVSSQELCTTAHATAINAIVPRTDMDEKKAVP